MQTFALSLSVSLSSDLGSLSFTPFARFGISVAIAYCFFAVFAVLLGYPRSPPVMITIPDKIQDFLTLSPTSAKQLKQPMNMYVIPWHTNPGSFFNRFLLTVKICLFFWHFMYSLLQCFSFRCFKQ